MLILTILGILGLLAYIVPFLFAGIMNAGSIAGGLFSLFLLLCGLFWRSMKKPLKRGAAALILLIFLIAGIETVFMSSAAADRPEEAATLIVLGCRVKNGHASLMLRERIQAAYTYLEAHPDAVCIASGGQGKDEAMPEGTCIRQDLIAMGIAPERIYVEDRSTSTLENVTYSAAILEAEGLDPRLALVTNEFHMYRALAIARDAGYTADAVPARTLWILFPVFYTRELLAILAYWM